MSYTRKIKKITYASVAAVSVLVSLFSGSVLGENTGDFMPENEFYKEPYSSLIFDYKEPEKGASKFSDMTSGDWFYPYVDTLVRKGVINGKSESIYHPAGTLTLPECSALIVRCLGLENEAAAEKAALAKKALTGSDKWYIGYIKICVDAGIVPSEEYGFGYDKKGNFVMNADYFENVPVKRYELAQYIYNMTLLDGSDVFAKNTYSERGGLGHEFIRSGLYDLQAVSAYKSEISDFPSIPEKYRNAVLACYYNGIFNGDDIGNFNPESSITRAEIAKVISVLTDVSQRFGKDLRTDAFEAADSDYRTDLYGKRKLTKDAGYRILLKSAEAASYNGKYIKIPLYANAPMGYLSEVYVYERSGQGTVKLAEINGKKEGFYTSGGSLDVFLSQGKDIIITYILRNIAEGGDVEGVLELTFTNGRFIFSDGISQFSGEAKTVVKKS